ncbi:2-desacetyl-2-hydroxyethyl bacteriochlorophyllide A dehydrogenase [Streptomyces sp. DvalAA-14]|uniref:zinc-dependent alcohol dehydrogenase n=1 Tax=unclassified Streptomyces TaxID=2593676 RepID=UPI00081BC468|nr:MULTISPECIES: alcohol dehydrogenase catalytic domain-containing protein [unclassified Streptomyces]MYS21179.1 alcohol dehydrogenase catalytic domain-containing protein [Streptomyces sp. SID4948]SCD86319.1 2-desacetyl-2-hydroxyethyl bacteriochlorophyllide A dehydrogenase [Streptomyces sp. DvalAA-14]
MSARRVAYTAARTLVVEEAVPSPPAAGQVRVEVAYTGICGTDLHVYHGSMDSRVGPPAVIGHEMSGRIAEIGPGVTMWQPGDHVTVMPLSWCGDCPACRAGHTHICHQLVFLGLDAPGCLQTGWTVPAGTLVRLPEELRLDHAALVEPTAVAVHDVRRAEVSPGEKVLVVGGGPIGLLIAVVARRAGADVLLVEPDPYRRSVAGALGLANTAPGGEDLAQTVARWSDGAGAAAAFEVSGAAAGVTTAVDLLATRGRLIQVAIHPAPREVSLHRFFWRELTLIGARLYDREDFETAVRLLTEGAIPAATLITRIEPLDRAAAAFEALESGAGVMKVLIRCGGAEDAEDRQERGAPGEEGEEEDR